MTPDPFPSERWEVVADTANRLPGEAPVRVAGPFGSEQQARDHVAQLGPENATVRRCRA